MFNLSKRTVFWASQVLTALVIVPAVVVCVKNYVLQQRELRCLAKNVYYESRGEPLNGQLMVAYVTVARSADHGEWGTTPCQTVYQRIKGVPQFSWTPYEEGPKGADWVRAQEVAETVYRDPKAAVPSRFFCVRYYKRTDDHGVSDRSKKYFGTLTAVGSMGGHTAYCEVKKRGGRG